MKIWILQTGEPMPLDRGSPRPMRAMNLASTLVARGHDITILTSAFYHQEKAHRSRGFEERVVSDNLRVQLIPSRGYERNIGPGRLIDHAQLALNLNRYLASLPTSRVPDIAFVGFPPIEVAAVLTGWLSQRGVPTVLDIKDQWPHLFVDAFPRFARPIAKTIFRPYFFLARRAFRNATGLCSMSDAFLEWACEFAGRARSDNDFVAPLTAAPPLLNAAELKHAHQWWSDQGVDLSGRRRVAFVGSLSQAFDFTSLAEVARRYERSGVDCQFVIGGDGPERAAVARLFAGCRSVIMPGWIDLPKIVSLMEGCSAVLAPYRTTDNFVSNIPNKVVDGLAYGLPVITSLDGVVRRLLTDNRAGFYAPDADSLATAVSTLLNDGAEQLAISKSARALYDERFGFESVYGGLAAHLERLSSERGDV
jgi:glycosyltransferase involved in cell wall biosynthesis